MTHWKTQFNYDYLGAYSLPDGKDIILTIRETKKNKWSARLERKKNVSSLTFTRM